MAYNGAIVCCHMPMEVEEEERRRRGRIKEKSRRWLKKNKVAGGGVGGGFRCIETRRGNWGIIGRDDDG